MKLNYKRTLLCGFAFFGITAFWQLYDNLISLMLKFDFGVSDAASGWIMSLDNIFALFLLPIFGALSDKTNTKIGKRMPYIIFGTLFAGTAFTLLPVSSDMKNLPLFMGLLLCALVGMGTYRSPAVSLMPDITPKPLRSKANAIINLMGTIGGLVVLVAVSLLMKTDYYALCPDGHKTFIKDASVESAICETCENTFKVGEKNLGLSHNSYLPLFAITAGIMLICLAALLFFVRENRFVREREQVEREYGISDDDGDENVGGNEKLRPEVKRSLIFLLLSVAFWYMAYNAVTTSFAKYVITIWGLKDGGFADCLMIAMAAAAVSYIPIGIISSKIGRKKMILIGCALLTSMFGVAFLFTEPHATAYVVFALVGIAWAAINVNSYPMVVEMSRGSNIGKYTGLYYTFSMAAQVITPILSGYLLNVSYKTLFPYATIFAGISFVTMLFVKHGDSKLPAKKSLLEHLDVDD